MPIILEGVLCILCGGILGFLAARSLYKKEARDLAGVTKKLLIANNRDRAIRLLSTYEE